MNINEPNTSRQLAAMIQGIKADARGRFIEDARNAESIEAFIEHFLITDYNA